MPTAAADINLASLYRRAAAATAAGSKSFYFATRFFPPHLAQSAHAVYWFCRTTDDIVDEAESVDEGRRHLDDWETQVRALFAGVPPTDPVLELFAAAVRQYEIPAAYPLDLLAGVRMDLAHVRYRTFDDLRVFCYRVASTVGLMMSCVVGFVDPRMKSAAVGHAIDLGIAMQLTNILRDVGTDFRAGRIYLPADEMAAFGYSEAELAAGVRDAAFQNLLRFQIERANRFYAAAEPGIAMLSREGRFAVRVASDVYRELLGEIERNRYDVFSRRAVVPARRKLWLTSKSMLGPAARHYWSRWAGGDP